MYVTTPGGDVLNKETESFVLFLNHAQAYGKQGIGGFQGYSRESQFILLILGQSSNHFLKTEEKTSESLLWMEDLK